jgi:hypothetical protein
MDNPNEVINVLSFLTQKELHKFAQVSKTWNKSIVCEKEKKTRVCINCPSLDTRLCRVGYNEMKNICKKCGIGICVFCFEYVFTESAVIVDGLLEDGSRRDIDFVCFPCYDNKKNKQMMLNHLTYLDNYNNYHSK